jgi:hypothetical protein
VLDMRTIRPLDIEARSSKASRRPPRRGRRPVLAIRIVASEVITQIIEHAFDWLDHQPVR